MNQALLKKAFILRQQSEEVEQQLNLVNQQIAELEAFNKSLEILSKDKEKEILAPLGKGVFAKASRKDEKLFVNVGAEIFVRKTPQETKQVIGEQIEKFYQIKIQLTQQLQDFAQQFHKMVQEVEKLKKK
jgi:prefoldin alpha subunit